jgi:hypothetical protein
MEKPPSSNNPAETNSSPEQEAAILKIKSQLDHIEQELLAKVSRMTLDGSSTVVNNLKILFNRQTGEIISGQYIRLTADQPTEAEEAPNYDPTLAFGYLRYEVEVPDISLLRKGAEIKTRVTDFGMSKFVGAHFGVATKTDEGYMFQAASGEMNEPTPTALENIRRALELRRK